MKCRDCPFYSPPDAYYGWCARFAKAVFAICTCNAPPEDVQLVLF